MGKSFHLRYDGALIYQYWLSGRNGIDITAGMRMRRRKTDLRSAGVRSNGSVAGIFTVWLPGDADC